MRNVAASFFAAFVAACSGEDARPASARADTILVGRVVASRNVVTFVGDLAYDSHAHAVAPRESPSSRVIVVTSRTDCPIAGNSAKLDRMTIRETQIAFGVTSEEDRRWFTNLQVLSCTPLEQ